MIKKDYMEELIKEIEEKNLSKDDIAKLKVKLAGKYKLRKIPTDIEIYLSLNEEEAGEIKKYLVTKPTRTISGVAVIAIMTKPYPCPHGKCIYCPGGLNSEFGDVPQSYTGHEPSTMRGIRNHYDAYLQVMNRLEQYIVIGQNPEKVELIIMGGTFPFFPEEYQAEFVKHAFQAMNDFSDLFYTEGILNLKKFKDFFELPGDKSAKDRIKRIQQKLIDYRKKSSLEEEQNKNENSKIKCIGLTIETKPDYGFKEHGNLMLKLGCTRIELGIQTVYDDILKKVNRGHTIEDSRKSIKELRDLGFKLNFHLMPGLPGVNMERERRGLKQIFSDSSFRPDMVKIYPTMVFKHTGLYELYKLGKYKPLTTEEAASLIAEFLSYTPRYCRVMRVQRDIPTSMAIEGVGRNNLRQYVDKEMEEKGWQCNDIRAREIGHKMRGKVYEADPEIRVEEYAASQGKEFFISIDDKKTDSLIGFCRMRFPSEVMRKEITKNSALIRELHIYGKATAIGKEGKVQHKGFGKQLMEKAEEIAKVNGKNKMVVISGIGVRKYYEKLGYHLEGPYMVKELNGCVEKV